MGWEGDGGGLCEACRSDADIDAGFGRRCKVGGRAGAGGNVCDGKPEGRGEGGGRSRAGEAAQGDDQQAILYGEVRGHAEAIREGDGGKSESDEGRRFANL